MKIIKDDITFKLKENKYIHIEVNTPYGIVKDYFSIDWFKRAVLCSVEKNSVFFPFDGQSIDVYPGVQQLLSTHHPELLI